MCANNYPRQEDLSCSYHTAVSEQKSTSMTASIQSAAVLSCRRRKGR